VADLHAELLHRAQKRLGTNLRRGKYTIDRLLGVGAMGAVYAATHRNGSRVAIKILHGELSRIDDVKQRFLREGYFANRVRHPGIVRVIDDDIDDDGSTFLVMELLEGITLAHLWEMSARQLPLMQVGAIVDAMLDVLEAVHAEGIVHRDVKPENVFLTADSLKLLDLGIARLLEESMRLTASGQMMGTPEFAAPEQAAGKPREVDARSDIYAVGATAFTLLTGRFVHEARGAMEAMVFAATRPARSLFEVWPHAPPLLANVVDVALSFEKDRRWTSASAMRTALHTALAAYGPLDPSSARAPANRGPGAHASVVPASPRVAPTMVAGSPASGEEPILLLKPKL
jgi:serine/threonine-protein kinase